MSVTRNLQDAIIRQQKNVLNSYQLRSQQRGRNVLGGSSGSAGGSGGPPGGFVGKLIQTKVAYDTTEAVDSSGSSSLLDNLNHIRYDINDINTSGSYVRNSSGSSTDNAIARWDGTSGSLVQDSNVTVDDSGNITTSGSVDGVDVSDMADAYFYASQASADLSNEVVVRVIDDDSDANVFVGNNAGTSITSGNMSVAIGYYALHAATSGYGNTAIGQNALLAETTGSDNVAVGTGALHSQDGADQNIGMGTNALASASSGSKNVSIGHMNLYSLTSGSANTAVGHQAGANLMLAGHGNVFLGYQAGYNESGSNKLYVDNSNTSEPLIYGEFDNDLLQVNGSLDVGDSTNYTEIKSDGEINLHGTARVRQHQYIKLETIKLGPSKPPARNNEDGFGTLDFDDSDDEQVFFKVHVPSDTDRSEDAALHLDFFVDASPGTDEVVRWNMEYKVLSHGDVFDFSAGTTTKTKDVTILSTSSNKETHHTDKDDLVVDAADIPATDGMILVKLQREGTHGNDDYTGDVRLCNAHLTYIADQLGKAT